MKIFDFKNPRHIEILREEISRTKKILTEGFQYSEDEIWDAMTPEEKLNAIVSSGEYEKEQAESYIDAKWDEIPDSITDLINLSDFMLARYDIRGGGSTNIGAINHFLKKDPDVQKVVDTFIQKVGRNELRNITTKQSFKLLTAVHQYLQSKNPIEPKSQTQSTSKINPYDEPASRGYMGAKYRGD